MSDTAINPRFRFYVARGKDVRPRAHVGVPYPPWVVVDRLKGAIVTGFSYPGRSARAAARRYVREHNDV